MTEEPYRWLEAIGNRREYVQHQLTGGSPVLAVRLDAGILLLGVGTGQSKVFEIHDRHALAGLGHPADLERLRQALIDAAHLEAFARSPNDVALRRLVGFNLSPQLKTAFEQLFAPPFIVRLLLAELALPPAGDVLLKLHFDGTFTLASSHVAVLAPDPARELVAETWLENRLTPDMPPRDAIPFLLQAWQAVSSGSPLPDAASATQTVRPTDLGGRRVEAALLHRASTTQARYAPLPSPPVSPPVP